MSAAQGKPGATVDPGWTRQAAIAQIGQARNMAEVFEIANRALGPQRQSWGDTLEDAAECANLWSMSSFTVAAQDKLDVKLYSNTAAGVDGEKLKACSLDAAKAMATHLISPREPTQSRTIGLQVALVEQLCKINDQAGLIQDDLRYLPRQDVIGLFLGGDMRTAVMSESAMKTLAKSRMPTWQDIATHLAGNQEQMQHQAASSPASVDPLVEQFGFSRISVGPVGGMASALACATQVQSGFEDLAKLVQVPPQSIGLDGICMNINHVFPNDFTAGTYNSVLHGLSTGTKTEHLGHEWMHAVEEWVERDARSDELKDAMGQLVDKLHSLTPNPGVVEGYANLTEKDLQDKALSDRLATDGSFLARMVAKRGKLPPSVSQVLNKYRNLHQSKAKEGGEELAQAFNRHLSRQAPRMGEEEARAIVEKDSLAYKRSTLFKDAVKDGKSAYLATAKDVDLIRDSRYWTLETEVLARASEVYFAQAGNQALVEPEGNIGQDLLRPRDAERAQAIDAFGKFFGVFSKTMQARFPATVQPQAHEFAHAVDFPVAQKPVETGVESHEFAHAMDFRMALAARRQAKEQVGPSIQARPRAH